MPVIVPVQDTRMRYSPPPPPYQRTVPLPSCAPTKEHFTFRVDVSSPDFKKNVPLPEDRYEMDDRPVKRTKL